jgi:hypothetical protein
MTSSVRAASSYDDVLASSEYGWMTMEDVQVAIADRRLLAGQHVLVAASGLEGHSRAS